MLDMGRISEHQRGEGLIPEVTELTEGNGEGRAASCPCFEGCVGRRSDRPNHPPDHLSRCVKGAILKEGVMRGERVKTTERR